MKLCRLNHHNKTRTTLLENISLIKSPAQLETLKWTWWNIQPFKSGVDNSPRHYFICSVWAPPHHTFGGVQVSSLRWEQGDPALTSPLARRSHVTLLLAEFLCLSWRGFSQADVFPSSRQQRETAHCGQTLRQPLHSSRLVNDVPALILWNIQSLTFVFLQLCLF